MANRPRIGSEFAGYRIEAQAGRGGASVVYQAVNLALGNRVALKVLAPEFFDDDAVRERFVRESQIAASINHPNIIPIHAAGDADGFLYIVMRFVEGADLKALLTQRGALPPARVMNIVRQVGRALDTAHQRGLVHRDVKPANVLLEQVGTDHEHAYLADFGLTKRTDSHTGLTGSGHFIGTIDYMAPEQIEGADVDGRADVYALTCLTYQCLTGLVPFPKDAEMAVLYAHINEAPPTASVTQPGLPPTVDGVIARGMAKSPADRYATCAELVAGFDAALAGHALEPVRAQPPPVPPSTDVRTPPEPGSRPEAVLAQVSAPVSKPDASRPARTRPRWPLLAAAVAVLVLAALGGYYLTSRSHSAGASDAMAPSGTGAMSDLQKFAYVALGSHKCPGDMQQIVCRKPPQLQYSLRSKTVLVSASLVKLTRIGGQGLLGQKFRQARQTYGLKPNSGRCIVDHHAVQWGHTDDWWHNYPGKAEYQDGKNAAQAQGSTRPSGAVLCATDHRTKRFVIVWTQQGTDEPAGMMAQHGVLVLGRIEATSPVKAYRYWYAAHHNVMTFGGGM
jgi:serine/threonine protein kinase